MTRIALLGTGLLGAGFVENLLAKGHAVTVWNRTASKTAALVERGATAAADPAAAVQNATHVHLVLSEDPVVDEVVAALRPGLPDGAWVIDHSTNLPAKVAARYAGLRAEGVRYVPAPVFMSPKDARNATGLMVVSATDTDAAALQDHLAAMTGKVAHVGDQPALAAAYKLAGNSMYFALTAALNDVLAIGRGTGVEDATMLKLFEFWKIGGAMPVIGEHVSRGDRGGASFELTMARKDARLMHEAAGVNATVALPAVIAAMDRAIANGAGSRDFLAFLGT
ncbi:MAG: NAD(P)-dependent oxidoreductase [Planctomycetes bacterium]|nr:NAD(P)-dependent oxidoreductase [Planctomycetota bacterium]